MIKEEYVKEMKLRIGIYRSMEDMEEKKDIDEFGEEIIESLGKMKEEVKNIIKIVYIKEIWRRENVEKIDEGKKGVVIKLRKEKLKNKVGMVKMIGEKG